MNPKTAFGEWHSHNTFIHEGKEYRVIPVSYLNMEDEEFPFKAYVNYRFVRRKIVIYAYLKCE